MPDSDFRFAAFEPANPQSGRGFPAGDSPDVEGGGRAPDFADAAAVIGRSLGDDGGGAWTPDAFSRRRDAEIACLSAWAGKCGLWLAETGFTGRVRGRMEHDIIRVGEPVRRIAKVTRGQRFGFYPHADPMLVSGMVSDWFGLRPGTPLQYLRRMALTHELFPALEHRLEGFVMLERQFRIVISQCFIDPVAAARKAIGDFFIGAGFERLLPEAWYRAANNVAIFDAGTTNILEFAGHLFPIDVLPIQPAGFLLERIREALRVPEGLR